jgi:hypothetical protein
MERYVEAAVRDMLGARDELDAALAEVGPRDWGRYVPYGSRTLHDLLAHIAAADQAWAMSARGLLKGEADAAAPRDPAELVAARERAVERGRALSPPALIDEMRRRRKLLLSLYELLEQRHLALPLRSFGERHNSVRERIWLGYHDRLHAHDVRRALRMNWHPPRLDFLPEIRPTVEALQPGPVLYVIYSVDPVAWEHPSPVPGWTYRQVLAHLATGDWVFQGHLRHIVEHGSVKPWPEIPEGNARLQAERQHSTVRALIDEYLSMRHQTMLLLAELRPEHLRLHIDLWFDPQREPSVLSYILSFHRHEQQHAEQHLRPAMKYARYA